MSLSRVYYNGTLNIGAQTDLDKAASNHLSRVLRLKTSDQIQLFNGDGNNYLAGIKNLGKTVTVNIVECVQCDTRSPIEIHLGQAISRNDRMDTTIQKAVELGVNVITPIISERVQFRLDEQRTLKKIQHWQHIIISACEQSGRTDLPVLNKPTKLNDWLVMEDVPTLVFVPNSRKRLKELTPMNKLRLLIGPEGGFSDEEIQRTMNNASCNEINLGPRILRTETAGMSVISILQSQFGDI